MNFLNQIRMCFFHRTSWLMIIHCIKHIRDKPTSSTMSHLLVCEQACYRHTQARPPLWVQTAQLRPGNGCHGDGCPGVQLEEGRHWPLPLRLSGSYPAVSHWSLGGTGTGIKIGAEMYTEDELDWVCVCVRGSVSLTCPLLPWTVSKALHS